MKLKGNIANMDGIETADAMRYLVEEIGEQTPKTLSVFDHGDAETKLVFKGRGAADILKYAKPPVERNHAFRTLDGLLKYLNSDHCKGDKGIIFVGTNAVHVELEYRAHGKHQVRLPLAPSEEYAALMKLKSVAQKELWRLLVTSLWGCLPPDLLAAVRSLKVSAKDEGEVEIDSSGLSQSKGTSGIIVTFPAQNRADNFATIADEWTFNGRIWECFDPTFEIHTRLELTNDNGLRFTFHPRRLETRLMEARASLVANIALGIPSNFTVHEGEFNG